LPPETLHARIWHDVQAAIRQRQDTGVA
jgi:hypothetical protein